MTPDLIAVIDVGKTNAKLALVEAHTGEVIWRVERVTPALDGPIVRQLDVAGIEAWLLASLSAAPNKARIRALVPIAHGAAAVLIGKHGQVLVAADYEDPAFESVAEAYRPLRDPFEKTLSPFLPLGLNIGRQLFYLQTRAASVFDQAERILLYPQYWAWRLCGIAASELTSLGCHTDLWHPLEARYSSLAEQRGWAALMPPLRSASDTLGSVTPEIARATGLDPSCRVVCGIHDSNASYLCHLAARSPEQPFAVVSSGTWTVVMAQGAKLSGLREACDMLANVNAFGAPVATARFMGGREYEVIAGEAGMQVTPTPQALLNVLEKRAMALPCFANAGGPFAGHAGKLIAAGGLTPEERAALATLYLALMTDTLLELLGASGEIIIDGPLAGNPLYGATVAALRAGTPVLVSGTRNAATIAGVLLAANAYPPSSPGRAAEPLVAPALMEYRRAWREQLGNIAPID